jgi:alkylhydroperoxidase family enzyme
MNELRPLAERAPDPRLAAYLEQVRTRAYAITDADVQSLKDAGVTEDEIFEQTVAVAIREGLRRYDAAEAVL